MGWGPRPHREAWADSADNVHDWENADEESIDVDDGEDNYIDEWADF